MEFANFGNDDAMFGSWGCLVCTLVNTEDSTQCLACGSMKTWMCTVDGCGDINRGEEVNCSKCSSLRDVFQEKPDPSPPPYPVSPPLQQDVPWKSAQHWAPSLSADDDYFSEDNFYSHPYQFGQQSGKAKQYWKKGTGFGYQGVNNWDPNSWVESQKQKDSQIENVCQNILARINQLSLSPTIAQLVRQSCIVNYIKHTLKNDSLLDMEQHMDIYITVFSLCSSMAQHKELHDLFHDDEGGKTLYATLMEHRKQARLAQKLAKSGKSKSNPKNKRKLKRQLSEEEKDKGLYEIVARHVDRVVLGLSGKLTIKEKEETERKEFQMLCDKLSQLSTIKPSPPKSEQEAKPDQEDVKSDGVEPPSSSSVQAENDKSPKQNREIELRPLPTPGSEGGSKMSSQLISEDASAPNSPKDEDEIPPPLIQVPGDETVELDVPPPHSHSPAFGFVSNPQIDWSKVVFSIPLAAAPLADPLADPLSISAPPPLGPAPSGPAPPPSGPAPPPLGLVPPSGAAPPPLPPPGPAPPPAPVEKSNSQKAKEYLGKLIKKGKPNPKSKQILIAEEKEEDPERVAESRKLYIESLEPFKFGHAEQFSGHFYRSESSDPASGAISRKWQKRLASEFADLSRALPVSHDSSIFMRVHEQKMGLVRFLVIAPSGTPYACGCYLFDAFFPPQYPLAPPKVNLMTTGGGSVRFNPNLYNCGKVCLSLLGTWEGEGGETWGPHSTFLQVCVSIQSLIFIPDPYFNEPGYEPEIGTPQGQQNSEEYNVEIRRGNMQHAILDMLKNPPKDFEDIIHNHFFLRKNEVLKTVEKWCKKDNRLKLLEKIKKELCKLKEIRPPQENYDSE